MESIKTHGNFKSCKKKKKHFPVKRFTEKNTEIQSALTNLKRRNDSESFKNSGTEPREQPPLIADLPSLRVLESALKHGIGAHSKRVLESEVSSEGSQALPQGTHALGASNRGAAVDYTLVIPGPVELEPGLDDVDRLQTRGLHDSAERA